MDRKSARMRGNGKDLERGQGNSWKHSLLALLSRGPVLLSGVTGN